MCIAVNEEDINEAIRAIVNKKEPSTIKIEATVMPKAKKPVIKHAPIKKPSVKVVCVRDICQKVKDAILNIYNKCINAAKEYTVFDTVVGRERIKGTFKHKCVCRAEKIKEYINADKNRASVAFGGSVALIAVALLVVVLNFSVGFEAVVNGQSIGIMASKNKCEQLVNEVNMTLAQNFGEDSMIAADIVTIPRLVPRGSFTSDLDAKNGICKLSDKMHEMYVIYLDDTQLCALATAEEAQQVLNNFRDYYTGGKEDVVFETDRPLTIRTEHAPLTLLRGVKEAVAVLNGSERQENEYTIMPGDTLWSISRKFDTSIDEILSINPDIDDEDIIDGDVITVKSYVPVVTVTTKQVKEYKEAIAYNTEIVETDSMYRGRSEVTRAGENGEVAVVASITKQNGLEISREILSEQTLKEPITQIKKVGTKEPPKGYGTGKFISPVYGTITSRYGYRRSGFHKGIDIANSYGTPIRAADNGKVITAGWSGLFGKLVKIDHQNGYVTYYAHNSSITVRVGETVAKGEIIAYMGSTGNSTGNHCHFEIHKNGVVQNPSNYI